MEAKLRYILEEYAVNMLQDGMSARKKDVDLARKNFSYSYAAYSCLEDGQLARLCHRFMLRTGLSEEGAKIYEEKAARKITSLVRTLEKIPDRSQDI